MHKLQYCATLCSMKHLTYAQFKEAAANIYENVPFELFLRTEPDGSQSGLVPYIMNDSMECWLVLENCRIVGTPLENFNDRTQVEFADHTMGISVRQGDNVYTAWFTGVQQHLQLYRYHEIGHFWTNDQEQWRRLVYMVGTIYDKLKYAPEPCCTPEEMALAPLMEFTPFRVWSPVSESILPLYPESKDGALTFAALAEEAGDRKLAKKCRFYAKHPNPFTAFRLANRLASEKSIAVYDLILNRINAAAAVYPARDYGEERNAKMQAEREKVTKALYAEGFTGTYPLFRKAGMEILATEEHPFTILESDEYRFRIQFMVSQHPNDGKYPNCVNRGFFAKKGNQGYIYREE